MRQQFLFGIGVLCVALASFTLARAANTLDLGTGETEINTEVNIPLQLDTDDEVQGLVAAFDWDGAIAEGVDLMPMPALEEADTVVTRVEPDYMVLGVVMDSDPNDPGSPEILGPAQDIPVARVTLSALAVGTTPLEFQDTTYNTVDTGPLLDNIVVVGGLSIGAPELGLDDGELNVVAKRQKLKIESGENPDGSGAEPFDTCGTVRILMDNNFDVEGFVTVVCHDSSAIELVDIQLGADSLQADFAVAEIENPIGGAFGVVIDLIDPMAFPPNINPGEDRHIATYIYCCTPVPAAGSPPVCVPLRFCDMEVGTPLKDNLIVEFGSSITAQDGLVLEDDGVEFCCNPPVGPETEDDDDKCQDGIDNDGDGAVDCDDQDCRGTLPCPVSQAFRCAERGDAFDTDIRGPKDGNAEVCFYLDNPEDHNVGSCCQFDHIQGFSMAVSYCCDIQAIENFNISGTILEALGAEFVSIQADNDPTDGDGCELIIGVLVDALPPFDGGTIPPLPDPQLMGCVEFEINPDAECGDMCPIEFVDGLNGRGNVPIKNLISIENNSSPVSLFACKITIAREETFIRGDCNFSVVPGMENMAVDISDAAAVVSYLFQPTCCNFDATCLDACDCQDDGRVDLADAICILQFLFQFGRYPPAPGPGLDPAGNTTPVGPDPTFDLLDCEDGDRCDV